MGQSQSYEYFADSQRYVSIFDVDSDAFLMIEGGATFRRSISLMSENDS